MTVMMVCKRDNKNDKYNNIDNYNNNHDYNNKDSQDNKTSNEIGNKEDKETCLMCELFTIFPTLVINHAFHPNILLASFVSREENIQYIFRGMDFLYLKEIQKASNDYRNKENT